jgi:hypothetical protein
VDTARALFEAALAPGETLLWSDRPHPGALGALARALGLSRRRAYAFTSARRGLVLDGSEVLAFELPARASVAVVARPGAEHGTIDLGEVEIGPVEKGPRTRRRVRFEAVAYPWSVLEALP